MKRILFSIVCKTKLRLSRRNKNLCSIWGKIFFVTIRHIQLKWLIKMKPKEGNIMHLLRLFKVIQYPTPVKETVRFLQLIILTSWIWIWKGHHYAWLQRNKKQRRLFKNALTLHPLLMQLHHQESLLSHLCKFDQLLLPCFAMPCQPNSSEKNENEILLWHYPITSTQNQQSQLPMNIINVVSYYHSICPLKWQSLEITGQELQKRKQATVKHWLK